MDANLLHDIIFYVMYAALAIALVIIIERTLYFAYTQRQARRLEQALTPDVRRAADLPDELTQRNSLPMAVIAPVLAQKHRAGDRETIGDLIDAQYLLSKPPMARGLWLLETVVTAAPLLGLLGTVMGIIETFKALAARGVRAEPGVGRDGHRAVRHWPRHRHRAAVPGGQQLPAEPHGAHQRAAEGAADPRRSADQPPRERQRRTMG